MEGFQIRAPKGANKKKRIIGRGSGSGKGKTSGKGNKGQNARAGGGVRPGFEGGQMPLYRRIARRGFSNYPFKEEVVAVNLDVVDASFADGDTVNLDTLRGKGVLKRTEALAKILGRGELTKKITVEGILVSAAAEKKILAAGGRVAGGPAEAPIAADADSEKE